MKGFKKLLTGILAATLAFTMNVTAMAAGTNTITLDGAVKDESYSIYKLLDLDVKANKDDATKYDGYSYTINDDFAGFWAGDGAAYITTNEVGTKKYVVWNKDKESAADLEAFGKLAAAWAKANGKNPVRTIKADASKKVVFDQLENGYYMITSTLGTAVTIASTPTDQDQNIVEKNNGNTTEKKVLEAKERSDGKEEYGQSNDAAVGDVVTFKAKVSIAKNSINVKYHDTMTNGLTYNNDVKVYSDEACTVEVASTNYSVAAGSDGETFVVSFNDSFVSTFDKANTDLYLKYTAVLNDQAVVTTPEVNTPSITWGDSGKYKGTPTNTTTHKFQIQKYNGADANKNPLAGAKFQLFTTETAGQALTLAVNADGSVYRVVADATKLPEGYSLAPENKIVTLSTGLITVEGVDSDLYYLEETDAPLGFTKLENRIAVTVNATNDLTQPVENNSGSILPSTGGMGTTTFYVIGAVLVIAAVAYFMLRRKADAE